MKIGILVSVVQGSRRGNEITAERWMSLLESLGHDVRIEHAISGQDTSIVDNAKLGPQQLENGREPPFGNAGPDDNTRGNENSRLDCDLLIAIHAVKCQQEIQQFKQNFPSRPVVVCLSGTDLHGVFESLESDSASSQSMALASLDASDRIILLEPQGLKKIPSRFHDKCRVIFQSAEPVQKRSLLQYATEANESFVVSVLGHLRDVKDPLRTATAARRLPANSKVLVQHVGKILEEKYRDLVEVEQNENARYKWLGLLSHDEALQVLVNSRLTVLSSIAEGAPSVISEAVVNGVPILATRIDAVIGLLGADYPGLFEVGDSDRLTELLSRSETDEIFLVELTDHLQSRQPLFSPGGEKDAWAQLLAEL